MGAHSPCLGTLCRCSGLDCYWCLCCHRQSGDAAAEADALSHPRIAASMAEVGCTWRSLVPCPLTALCKAAVVVAVAMAVCMCWILCFGVERLFGRYAAQQGEGLAARTGRRLVRRRGAGRGHGPHVAWSMSLPTWLCMVVVMVWVAGNGRASLRLAAGQQLPLGACMPHQEDMATSVPPGWMVSGRHAGWCSMHWGEPCSAAAAACVALLQHCRRLTATGWAAGSWPSSMYAHVPYCTPVA